MPSKRLSGAVVRGEPARWPLPSLESAAGCFETMRIYRGQIFRLDAHLDRLYASAKYLALPMPESPGPFGRRLIRAVRTSNLQEATIRVALIRRPHQAAAPSIVVQPVPLPPPELYERGIRVAIVPTKKFGVAQIDPHSKFSSRLGSVMAVMEAQLREVDEAVFLDATGSVTESTASNLGVIRRGAFLAPPCWLGLLAGVTWQTVVEVAKRLRIPVAAEPLTRHDVYNADEAFLLSTIKEVLPVTVADGRRIGDGRPGPITKRLQRGFRSLVARELRHGRR